VDPVDDTQLLVATCRVWRGPAGPGWTSANAISPVLSGGAFAVSCNGNALIRSIAAMPLASGGEIIYVGMYGSATNGSLLPGHLLRAIYNPASGSAPTWNDLTLNPVVNSVHALDYYGLDISSITIDSHDASGNTVYVTVAGMPNQQEEIETVYRTTNGGSTWTNISSNLPYAPASSLAVDPQNANTVYVATDAGVYFTPEVANCGAMSSAPGFPPPPPWLSAPRPQRLPRTCWSRPPMGAASGKRRSSPQPRPSAPPPSIPPRTPSPTRALIPPAAGSPSLSSTPAASLSHPVPLPSPATSAKPTTA
jgi:hypothetical protein